MGALSVYSQRRGEKLHKIFSCNMQCDTHAFSIVNNNNKRKHSYRQSMNVKIPCHTVGKMVYMLKRTFQFVTKSIRMKVQHRFEKMHNYIMAIVYLLARAGAHKPRFIVFVSVLVFRFFSSLNQLHFQNDFFIVGIVPRSIKILRNIKVSSSYRQ